MYPAKLAEFAHPRHCIHQTHEQAALLKGIELLENGAQTIEGRTLEVQLRGQ